MHEKHARALAVGIGVTVTAAAFLFAARDGAHPPPPPGAKVAAPVTAPAVDAASAAARRGQALFVALDCARCHAFRGVGNPSGALDEAVTELDAAELERWIVAAPEVADELSRKARDAKARYRELPREDLDALIAWLGGGE